MHKNFEYVWNTKNKLLKALSILLFFDFERATDGATLATAGTGRAGTGSGADNVAVVDAVESDSDSNNVIGYNA